MNLSILIFLFQKNKYKKIDSLFICFLTIFFVTFFIFLINGILIGINNYFINSVINTYGNFQINIKKKYNLSDLEKELNKLKEINFEKCGFHNAIFSIKNYMIPVLINLSESFDKNVKKNNILVGSSLLKNFNFKLNEKARIIFAGNYNSKENSFDCESMPVIFKGEFDFKDDELNNVGLILNTKSYENILEKNFCNRIKINFKDKNFNLNNQKEFFKKIEKIVNIKDIIAWYEMYPQLYKISNIQKKLFIIVIFFLLLLIFSAIIPVINLFYIKKIKDFIGYIQLGATYNIILFYNLLLWEFLTIFAIKIAIFFLFIIKFIINRYNLLSKILNFNEEIKIEFSFNFYLIYMFIFIFIIAIFVIKNIRILNKDLFKIV